MNEVSQQEVGELLLFPIFRSLDEGYKKKYLKDVWEQFENNIRASAYTSKLSTFFENITRTMPIQFQQQFATEAMRILNSGKDKEVLTWLRDETTYLILIARMKNEDRKAAMKPKDLFTEIETNEKSISEPDALSGIV